MTLPRTLPPSSRATSRSPKLAPPSLKRLSKGLMSWLRVDIANHDDVDVGVAISYTSGS